MEKVVAKRALKKSYYDSNNTNSLFYENSNRRGENKQSVFSKYRTKVIYKFWLQTITMASIAIFCVGIKYLNIQIVKDASITKKIVSEYKKSYSEKQILSKTKELAKYSYVAIKPIIPKQVEESIISVINKLVQTNKKENVTNEKENKSKENLDVDKEEGVLIYEENSNINKEDKASQNIGVAIEQKEEVVATVSSSLSSEQDIATKIKNEGFDFTCPLKGTITSRFGAREVIFEGIDSYHTGTDIAAPKGTAVVSSTKGKVTEATYNKYNGYFVEVTTGDIVTKYCHLSKISVKKGESINAGKKIGEVGSTGLSTGPHLHFEVVYNGTKINPELIVKL